MGLGPKITYQQVDPADYFVTRNEVCNSWSHTHHLTWNICACKQMQDEDMLWKRFNIWV